jgi:hypothetical protein
MPTREVAMLVKKLFVAIVSLLAIAFAQSCDIAKDTADTSKGGAKNAAGIAGKMKQGTAGDADLDSGETPSDSTEDSGG